MSRLKSDEITKGHNMNRAGPKKLNRAYAESPHHLDMYKKTYIHVVLFRLAKMVSARPTKLTEWK